MREDALNARESVAVLMADDDEDDCMLARDAFEESGAPGVLTCVEDGIELLDYLLRSGKYERKTNGHLPTLILLDLNMPRKDGRQALKEIKAIPAFKDIPLVVLTTSQEEKDIVYCRKMGADLFITKPATFNEWVRIMKSLVDKWLYLPESAKEEN